MALCLILCLLLTPLQAQDLSITLLNGDCDGDNEVTLFDSAILSAAFGSVPGDPNWDPRADLDGDLEVTLYDFAILQRNFGATGAEPFDPALPRQPALQSGGYELRGVIELEGWQGEAKSVRIEALQEDDPQQVVYYLDNVQTGSSFTLRLPQSGAWWVKVTGASGFLVAQHAAKRRYLPTPQMWAFFVTPGEGEAYADARYDPAPIGVQVRVVDYDLVTFASANSSELLVNYERTQFALVHIFGDLYCSWRVVSGGGAIAPTYPGSLSATYYPPTLEPDEQEREVTIECTITDNSPDLARRDADCVITRRFRVVNRPTVHISVSAVDSWGNSISGTPIPSGELMPAYLRLNATSRKGGWRLDYVEWLTPWGTISAGSVDGSTATAVLSSAIPRNEEHRRFPFEATATFSMTLPPPVGRQERQDTKVSERLLGFDMTDRLAYNELLDDSRGKSIVGEFYVPNWFHNREGHWGNIISRFNEEYTYNGVRYPVVHWINATLQDLIELLDEDLANQLRDHSIDIGGFFDWPGVLAPTFPFDPAYRGRIYLFPECINITPRQESYGLVAGGIDLLARVVTHEFAHRDLFLRDWGGFNDENIGTPGNWLPLSGEQGIDADGDSISDSCETLLQIVFHFDPFDEHAVHRWWVGCAGCMPSNALYDPEMYARLWGEWDHYQVGSLDNQDWSVNGRQDY